MENRKWDQYEVALLVDTYVRIKDASQETYLQAVEELSSLLRQYGRQQGITVDDTYRNINGIKMRLQNIRFLFSNGRVGLSAYSKLDQDIVAIYQNDKEQFYKLLKDAEGVIGKNKSSEDSIEKPLERKDPKGDEGYSRFKAVILQEKSKDTLAEIFSIDGKGYHNVSIETLNLSVRATHGLIRYHITTVEELLDKTLFDLVSIRHLGAKSLKEILQAVRRLNPLHDSAHEMQKRTTVHQVCYEKQKKGFTRVWVEAVTKDPEVYPALVEKWMASPLYQAAQAELGAEFCDAIKNNPQAISNVAEALSEYITASEWEEHRQKYIEKIPQHRRVQPLKYYTDAYYPSNCPLTFDPDVLVKDYTWINQDGKIVADSFYKWVCGAEEKKCFERLSAFAQNTGRQRMLEVMQLRAERKTLEEVGARYGVTRERIRQIESKGVRRVRALLAKYKVLELWAADALPVGIVSPEQFQCFGEEYAPILKLAIWNNGNIIEYDQEFQTFFARGKADVFAQKINELLPDTFFENEKAALLNTIVSTANIPQELFERYVHNNYNHKGFVFSNKRITITAIYAGVLREHFPQGIHVSNEAELAKFLNYVVADYGEISLSPNPHALATRIASVGILCDRGVYKAKQERYITDSLANEIEQYLDKSPSSTFLINTVFSIFEDQLREQGVTNKYYLQGILKELFGDKYYFRRDYIAKDASRLNIYTEIQEYIRQFDYPVTNEEIKRQFPGLTAIVFNMAVSDSDFINYFGAVMAAEKLRLSSWDKSYLHKEIKTLLRDRKVHHIAELFAHLRHSAPAILNKCYITMPVQLFNVLAWFLEDDFQFDRPYIAPKGVRIMHPREKMEEFLQTVDTLKVRELSRVAQYNRFAIPSLLNYIDSLNDRFLLQNRDTISTIESIGIDYSVAAIVEGAVWVEVQQRGPFHLNDFQGIGKLPLISIPWNEWLLYSILKKWSRLLDVACTNIQYWQGVPIVGLKGTLDESTVSRLAQSAQKKALYNIDDLSNIDELIAEELAAEIEQSIQ